MRIKLLFPFDIDTSLDCHRFATSGAGYFPKCRNKTCHLLFCFRRSLRNDSQTLCEGANEMQIRTFLRNVCDPGTLTAWRLRRIIARMRVIEYVIESTVCRCQSHSDVGEVLRKCPSTSCVIHVNPATAAAFRHAEQIASVMSDDVLFAGSSLPAGAPMACFICAPRATRALSAC